MISLPEGKLTQRTMFHDPAPNSPYFSKFLKSDFFPFGPRWAANRTSTDCFHYLLASPKCVLLCTVPFSLTRKTRLFFSQSFSPFSHQAPFQFFHHVRAQTHCLPIILKNRVRRPLGKTVHPLKRGWLYFSSLALFLAQSGAAALPLHLESGKQNGGEDTGFSGKR